MSASQLMRILQTIPSNAKYETSVFDPVGQDTTMKENQNSALNDNKIFERNSNPFTVENEEIYQLKGSRTDTSSLELNAKAGDKCWNPFMDDFSMDIVNGARDNGNESTDSSSTCVATSGLCETEKNMYTDKDVLDCELPEFTVCYKDIINYHIVKDICIDEGLPVRDKKFHGSYEKDESDHDFSLGRENKESEGAVVDMESFISNELATSSLEVNKTVNEDECEIEEESNINLNSQLKPNPSPESSLDKETANHGDTLTGASTEKSFIDKNLPIQEFGTRSFLRSFISSFNSEENKVDQLPDQIPSGIEVAKSLDAALIESDNKENIQATSSLYNSKLESGSITFNFNNSPEQVVSGVTTEKKDVNEQSVDLGNSHEQDSDGNLCEQSLKLMDEKKSNNSSATRQVQSINSNKEINHENISVEKDDNSGFVSVVSHLQHDEGETSFSVSGFINHSGPIPFSGSLSDGSATSTRSFAFPVMQNEWNSSPVRMAKADRRGFRKHRGWRLGLLCCRF